WRYSDTFLAPSTRPARSQSGGRWSTPVITPLAMAGAAPITTTNMIDPSVPRKRRMASGNQAIDGMVWMPVISEPMAARRARKRGRWSSAGGSGASRPASWASTQGSATGRSCSGSSTMAMAGDLLAEAGGDLDGERADRGRLDAAGPRDVDGELRRHPAGPAG